MIRKLPHLIFALALPGFAVFFLQALFVGAAALAQEMPVDGAWNCVGNGNGPNGGLLCQAVCSGVSAGWTVRPSNQWACEALSQLPDNANQDPEYCKETAGDMFGVPLCYPPGWDFSQVFCRSGSAATDNGVCVPTEALSDAQKCETGGWMTRQQFGTVYCQIANLHGYYNPAGECVLFPDVTAVGMTPRCKAVFGDSLSFPQKGEGNAYYVYNCDPAMQNGLVPATVNTIGATQCECDGSKGLVPIPFREIFSSTPCECDDSKYYNANGQCIPQTGDLPSTEKICRAFRGEVQTTPSGGKICSGVDWNDTFCILGSKVAFPCQGLFQHVRTCRFVYGRPAVDPWHCGPRFN